MVLANTSHDISFIEPTGSTEIGLMLVQDPKTRLPMWKEYDDPTLAQQFFSGEPDYSYLPPEKEIRLAQSDWRAGAGQEVFDSADDKRYWDSFNMDLRFIGKAMAGSTPTTTSHGALGSTADNVRAHVEYNDDLYIAARSKIWRLNGMGSRFGAVKALGAVDFAEFTDGNLYIAMGEGNKYYYMDKAELVIHTCEAAFDESVDTDVTVSTDNSDYMNGSKSVKFVVADGCGAGDILATDSFTSKDLTGYTDVSLWIKSSVALSAGDLQLLLDDTANCASPIEELDIPAVSSPNSWEMVSMSLATPASLGAIVSIGIKMVVDKGAFTLRIDDIRAASFVQSSLADGEADKFQVVGGSLWKANGANELKSSTDPSNGGSWSTATTVGSSSDEITALLEESLQLFIVKEDMVYYIDTDGNVNRLIPELKALRSSTNGVHSISWNGKLYIPWGTQGLLEYDSGTLNWRTPSKYFSNLWGRTGRIRALAADEQYLFATLSDGTYAVILAGREEEIDGTDRWVWHPIYSTTHTPPIYMFVSSVYAKRLWINSGSTTKYTQYFPLPTQYSDIDSDSSYTFVSDGYFYTPWLHGNLKGSDKAFIKLTLTMEDTDTNEYFEAHYQKLGDSTWTNIGDFKTSPTTTKYLPVDASDNNPISTMIRFKFVAKLTDTTTTPKLLGYDCRAVWYPTKRWLIECRVQSADVITRKDGKEDVGQKGSDIDTALTDAVEHNWPITLYPPEYKNDGDEITVKFLRAEKVLTKNMKGQNPEYQWNLLMAKVPLE